MLKALLARAHQGHRTMAYPAGEPPALPERFRGAPALDPSKCPDGCRSCADVCPTDAIAADGPLALDLGRCLFCTACVEACPEGAIAFTNDYRLATRRREDLVVRGEERALADALERKLRRLFGRSLKLRVVSAGDCNACSADVNVLGTIGWDLGRFGINYVASPRHADGLLITGPVTENMRLALQKTYDAVASPKIVDRRGGLRDQRGAVRGSPRAARRRVVRGSGRPLHPRLPAAPAHDPRRSAPPAGADRGREPGRRGAHRLRRVSRGR